MANAANENTIGMKSRGSPKDSRMFERLHYCKNKVHCNKKVNCGL
jgi:hypothetical protein